MTNANRSSKAKTVIPASERRKVEVYRAVLNATGGKKISPERAYEMLERGTYEAAKQTTKEQAEKAKKEADHKSRAREYEIDKLRDALSCLSDARDATYAIEGGKKLYFDHVAVSRFARVTIEEAGRQIEEAAWGLGLLKKQKNSTFFHAD